MTAELGSTNDLLPMRAVGASVMLVVFLAAASALAQDSAPPAPDAAKVRQAAEAFDGGVTAYKNKQYELAASRFEAADAAVPSPQAIRQAIRARHDAGQGSRAATLAAQALERYPNDLATTRLANEILEQLVAVLHKLSISCASPCVISAGTRTIPGQPTTRWTVYLDPEPTTVSASFFGNTGSEQVTVDAKPGGSSDVRFEPGGSQTSPSPPTQQTPTPPPAQQPPSTATPPSTPVVEPVVSVPQLPDKLPSGGGLPPIVFIGGVVVTAALGGVTIWSGIDTINNPGVDAVRRACAGRGTSCNLYQDGLAKETRTNILIGATAGAGALTLLAALFTRWGGSDENKAAYRTTPMATITHQGILMGVHQHF